jgi:hypothetical protein
MPEPPAPRPGQDAWPEAGSSRRLRLGLTLIVAITLLSPLLFDALARA